MTFLGGSPAVIDLGPLSLNYADPESGLMAGFDKLSGWVGGAPMQVNQSQRTGHGQFPVAGKKSGRVITINGWAVVDARALLASWLDTLSATLADGGFADLTITDDDQGVRSASVQLLANDPDWSGREWVRFQLSLLAPDPYIYGLEQSTSLGFAMPPPGAGLVFPEVDGSVDFGSPVEPASFVLENAGNAFAWPTFEVAGAADGFRIVSVADGSVLDFVGASSSVSIDAKSGRVLRDGINGRTRVRVSSWPSVPPFSQREFLFEPLTSATSAQLTARIRATYH